MKVKELFNSRKKDDIIEIGKTIYTDYPEKFNDLRDSVGAFLIFLEEYRKCETEIIDMNIARLVVIILNNYDDFIDQKDIIYKENDDENEIDYDKLETSHSVKVIDIVDFLKYRHTLGKTSGELKNDHLKRFSTECLSFIDRSNILNMEIAQICFDRMSVNEVAAKIYWEMTYYGLYNDTVEKRFYQFQNMKKKPHKNEEDDNEDDDNEEESNNEEEDDDNEEEGDNEEEEEFNSNKVFTISFAELEKIFRDNQEKIKESPELTKLEQDKEKIQDYRYQIRDDILKKYIKDYETTQILDILQEYTFLFTKNEIINLHKEDMNMLFALCDDTQLKVLFKEHVDNKVENFMKSVNDVQKMNEEIKKEYEDDLRENDIRYKMENINLMNLIKQKTLN